MGTVPNGQRGQDQEPAAPLVRLRPEQGPANKESATYPGHFASTQGSSNNSSAHPNQGKDGCSFSNFTPDPDKGGPGSAKGKGKHGASAATSSASVTVADADLKRATAHIENLENQIRMLAAARDAEHLKYAKATELANTQLSLQAQRTNELISAHAKTLRTSQLETFNAIAKIHEIRGHAEGFAENMLAKATQGEPPDMDATWAAFSGVLTTERSRTPNGASATKKKVPGSALQERLQHHRVPSRRDGGAPDSDPARGVPAHRSQGQRAADAGRLRGPR